MDEEVKAEKGFRSQCKARLIINSRLEGVIGEGLKTQRKKKSKKQAKNLGKSQEIKRMKNKVRATAQSTQSVLKGLA